MNCEILASGSCEKTHEHGQDRADSGENSVHGHCHCADHVHAAPENVNLDELEKGSATRAIYRIANMDCPMEEALIQKKLASIRGVGRLEFNLMQRTLVVNHSLPSTRPIEEALASIDMTPEPLDAGKSVVSIYSISAMDCPEEEKLIRARLSQVAGVRDLEFNLMRRTLKVRHDPAALPAISSALASLNMGAKLVDAPSPDALVPPAPKIPWKKLALATILAAISEAAELVYEWGAKPFGLDMQAWTLAGYPVLKYLPLLFAILAIALSGLSTYRKGWLAVSNFNLNINALMSVAVTGAVLIGQFPEAAMVMVLFNISEAIEAKALDRARKAIKELLALSPEKATVLGPDGKWLEMDIREVEVGSRVRVRPGEKVALDGRVLSGESSVNQAPITGESMPVEKKAGDQVYAGTINESGSFEFEVTAGAKNTTLARIIHSVEEAQGSRAPIQRFVDVFARYYTPAVFLMALLSALLPPLLYGAPWPGSIYMGLVLLVIGCPCALVISTPVSIVSGMAAATRGGILVKGGIFLEQGRLLKYLALDKTGTLTYGKPRQTDFVLTGKGDARLESIAASLAARSDHPVSKAIALRAEENSLPLMPVEHFEAIPGQGTSGLIDGRQWSLGNLRMVERLGKNSTDIEKRILELERQGKSVVALLDDAGVKCLLAAADTVKPGSVEAVAQLKKLGLKTIMLTGDNEYAAANIAAQAGVDEFRAGLLPEDKLGIIEELEGNGEKVGMVGDGINDAPALARANIGFSMAGEGTDTAIETADVAIMDDDLRKIPRFISLSRSTYAIMMQNIALALGIKAVFFALAFTGVATMWMAVFADVGASLLVVGNGLRAIGK